MFTGIVEELGALDRAEPSGDVSRLYIRARTVLKGSSLGDSISVNGCCLTVVDLGPDWWAADAVAETLGRTNLGSLTPGDPVNLERAVAFGGRVGGHLVQGHVDGVGTITRPAPDLEVQAPDGVIALTVEKGSVAVDGVSLTVVSLSVDRFSCAVIPHTVAATTLGSKRAGARVNLEADVLARYTARLLQGGASSPYTSLDPGGAAWRDRG